MTFPSVSGSNLNVRAFNLPGDFESAYNVVVLAFTEPQQYVVNSWMPFLNALKARYPLSVYELPILPRGTWMWRRMVDYWMVTGIPDPAVRAATITLYLDVPAFLRALALPGTDTIYTLLVDRAGRVHWRADGAFSAAQGQQLVEVLQTLPFNEVHQA